MIRGHHRVAVKSTGAGVRASGMESRLHHLLAVQPWVINLTALSPSFRIYKKRIVLLPHGIRLKTCGCCSALGPDIESHAHTPDWAHTVSIPIPTRTLEVPVLLCTVNGRTIFHQMNIWQMVA